MPNPNRLLRKALQGRIENTTTNLRKAKEKIENGDYTTAKKHAAKACIIDEHNIEARYVKGFCHQNLGEFSKAAETYRQITRLLPGSAVAHLYLADCLKSAGQIETAIEYYLEAVRLDNEGDVRELGKESIVALKENL